MLDLEIIHFTELENPEPGRGLKGHLAQASAETQDELFPYFKRKRVLEDVPKCITNNIKR